MGRKTPAKVEVGKMNKIHLNFRRLRQLNPPETLQIKDKNGQLKDGIVMIKVTTKYTISNYWFIEKQKGVKEWIQKHLTKN